MSRSGRKPGAAEAARRALARRVKPVDPDAQAIAQEVYEACVTLKPGAADDPLPLAVRGPLFALNVRALHVIRALHPDIGATEEEADAVISYLTDGWCAMMLEFDREHFRAWMARGSATAPIVRPVE